MKGDNYNGLTIFRDKGQVSDSFIKAFEEEVGVCLPVSYKDLLLNYNGVRFCEDYFDIIDSKGEKRSWCFLFKSFGGIPEEIELAQQVSDPDYYGISGLVCFGATGEGDSVCFDYRDDLEGCEPKVIVLIHDEFEEHEDHSVTRVIEFVVDTFDEFLGILYDDD